MIIDNIHYNNNYIKYYKFYKRYERLYNFPFIKYKSKGDLKKRHLFKPNEYWEDNMYFEDNIIIEDILYNDENIKEYLKNKGIEYIDGKYYYKPCIIIKFNDDKSETLFYDNDEELEVALQKIYNELKF